MKETNVNSTQKFNVPEYPKGNVFRNTDELGVVDVFINTNGTFWTLTPEVFIILKDDILGDNEESKIIPLPQEQNKVSEDFALKVLALVGNKEKFGDLK